MSVIGLALVSPPSISLGVQARRPQRSDEQWNHWIGKSLHRPTITQVQAVPENSAVTFTIPGTGDPGYEFDLPNQQFVAFDAICTHAGCEVGYDPGSGHLICPCHGAQYDPTHQAAVLQGPAQLPLTAVKIHIDSASGAITLE